VRNTQAHDAVAADLIEDGAGNVVAHMLTSYKPFPFVNLSFLATFLLTM
jgi:hypothetical protein